MTVEFRIIEIVGEYEGDEYEETYQVLKDGFESKKSASEYAVANYQSKQYFIRGDKLKYLTKQQELAYKLQKELKELLYLKPGDNDVRRDITANQNRLDKLSKQIEKEIRGQ
jgi:hypothetical protein